MNSQWSGWATRDMGAVFLVIMTKKTGKACSAQSFTLLPPDISTPALSSPAFSRCFVVIFSASLSWVVFCSVNNWLDINVTLNILVSTSLWWVSIWRRGGFQESPTHVLMISVTWPHWPHSPLLNCAFPPSGVYNQQVCVAFSWIHPGTRLADQWLVHYSTWWLRGSGCLIASCCVYPCLRQLSSWPVKSHA